MSENKKLRTLWLKENSSEPIVQVIDQRQLPHSFEVMDLSSVDEVAQAIKSMVVRGAPLIGATAAYGMYYACREAGAAGDADAHFKASVQKLSDSRPTAVNLFWAINQQLAVIKNCSDWNEKAQNALEKAHQIVEADVDTCFNIGKQGLAILEELSAQKSGETLHILTHCNAGMLGCIEWGTATAPIYLAHQKGIKVHVWVDETRPRNQGASLTTWELTQAGVPHTLIVDNQGGHLMQHGMVDMAIVGTDRTTRTGDVANKIGTYLKALAAFDNQVPFYVALPSTTIDWDIRDGLKEIPIEERSQDEVRFIPGKNQAGKMEKVLLCPETTPALNYGFDVTPARLVTALITERGVCEANEAGILGLFPERKEAIKL
ncbi:MAG: S-methyl-5-thioribose-1-phosphate isomerase [Bacteroidota bacterium]